MVSKKENLYWIDAVKAICMISVYLLHSEAYYGTGEVSLGYILMPFYVNGFFFVSGYLLFRKSLSALRTQTADYKHDIINALFRLIIPTLIFSSIIYIPKHLFHGGGLAMKQYIFDVFGGISFWFTSALVVSQFVIRSLLLTGQRSIWFYVVITGIIFFVTTYFINNTSIDTNTATHHFPWFYKTGLVYTFIMALGGVYSRYEEAINKVMKYAWVPLLILYIIMIALSWNNCVSLKFMGLGGRINILGAVTILCGVSLIIAVAKLLPNIKWLAYIGRNSIIFYFFSGVMPAAYSTVANIIFPPKIYAVTLLVTVTAALSSYILTKFVYNYAPFLVDLRKLKR